MNFELLQHEIDALEFYQELAKTADDIEIKKEALRLHFELLKSLHELEKVHRKEVIERDKAFDGNSKEISLARFNRRHETL